MSNTELPLEVRKALAIMQSAGDENGRMSAEEYNRACAELRKLGVVVATTSVDENGNEVSSATDKQTLVEDVQIHPWKEDADGNLFNPWCSDAEGEDAGWNVHSFAPNGEGGGEIIDDDDFDDYETALAHGQILAEKYGVPLRNRTLLMVY